MVRAGHASEAEVLARLEQPRGIVQVSTASIQEIQSHVMIDSILYTLGVAMLHSNQLTAHMISSWQQLQQLQPR